MKAGRTSQECPTCGARPGAPCRGLAGQIVSFVHRDRMQAARDAARRR